MKKNIFIAVFLLGATSLFAQVDTVKYRHNIVDAEGSGRNIDMKLKTIVPQNAISINVGYGVPFINNGFMKSEVWNNKTGTALNFGIDYRLQFMKSEIVNNEVVKTPSVAGIGIGLGISHFKQSAIMKNHTDTLHDFEGNGGFFGDVTLSYKGIKENLSLTYLDIPLYLSIGKPSQVKISGYFNVGIKASLLVANKFAGEGTYTSQGYDYATNCLIHNVDVLNFYTDKASYENSEYNLSKFVLWGSLSGGVNIPFSSLEKNKISKVILSVGAKLDYTILPISKSIAEPYFKGANYRINQSNILGSNGSRIFLPSVEVKLIYCIN